MMLFTGAGAARATLTENFAWAGILLQAMTGNMGVPGAYTVTGGQYMSGFQTAYGTPSVSGQYGRKAATYTSPQGPANGIAFQLLPDAILNRPLFDGGQMTDAQYRQSCGVAATSPLPNIHVWIPTHYNLAALMNVQKQMKACAALDLVVTIRNRMDETTCRVADIILPLVEEMERDPSFQAVPEWHSLLSEDFCRLRENANRRSGLRRIFSRKWVMG